MEKIISVYNKAGIKYRKIKAGVIIEVLFFMVYFVNAVVLKDFGETRMYTISALMLLIGLNVILETGNASGMTQGMDLAGMLKFYPVDSRKIYHLFVKESLLFSAVHLISSVLMAVGMGNGIMPYFIMVLADLAAVLYYNFCLYMVYGMYSENNQESAGNNGVVGCACIIMSPFIAVTISIIYKILI